MWHIVRLQGCRHCSWHPVHLVRLFIRVYNCISRHVSTRTRGGRSAYWSSRCHKRGVVYHTLPSSQQYKCLSKYNRNLHRMTVTFTAKVQKHFYTNINLNSELWYCQTPTILSCVISTVLKDTCARSGRLYPSSGSFRNNRFIFHKLWKDVRWIYHVQHWCAQAKRIIRGINKSSWSFMPMLIFWLGIFCVGERVVPEGLGACFSILGSHET